MDLGLGKKVVMITGASRGLGRAMAEALGAEGARLCLCARGAEALERAAAELRAKSYEVDAEAVDVADPVAAERWVEGVAGRMGGIDVLVNNAGGARMGALADLPESAWQGQFELNFVLAGAAGAAVRDRSSRSAAAARSSTSARFTAAKSGGPLTYNASKAAMHSFTKMLAREVRAEKYPRQHDRAGLDLSRPAATGSSVSRAIQRSRKISSATRLPAGRLGRPEEVAYAVVMLASPRASWITGANIPVDGAQGRSLI